MSTPTKAETLEALHKSQAHWKRHWQEEARMGEYIGIADCALCQLFWLSENQCEGCPVAKRTGRPLCKGSPHELAASEYNTFSRVQTPAFRAAARKEWEFLMSLEPKRRKK